MLLAPDRDRIPDARPVVSVREDDETDFLTEVERRALKVCLLSRRGYFHGRLAELSTMEMLAAPRSLARREALARERWHAARPLVRPGAARSIQEGLRGPDLDRLHARLFERGALSAFVRGRKQDLLPRFRTKPGRARLFDEERDLARIEIGVEKGPQDLWIKVGRLSTSVLDRSLRLRVSFGREGDDDATQDEQGLLAVAELARRLVPGAEGLEGLARVRAELETLVGSPIYFTQHIGYWNAPEGGAQFHHDSFDEPEDGRQRGVLFAQLRGRTVWLALSIADLATRVCEFVQCIEEGELPWIRQELERWSDIRRAVRNRRGLLAELARPGCGELGPIVDRGPEFTCFLADAGHALVLHPGDVLLLPNHGLERTAMHSVFAASRFPAYGLSVAIRVRPSRASA